jgi:hypothetical protein
MTVADLTTAKTRRWGDLSPRLYNGNLDPRNLYCGKLGELSVRVRDPRNTSCVEYVFAVIPLETKRCCWTLCEYPI